MGGNKKNKFVKLSPNAFFGGQPQVDVAARRNFKVRDHFVSNQAKIIRI